MVRTAENDDLLADLLQHPGVDVLKDRLKERHQNRANALGRLIQYQDGPLDQRKIDEERGFRRGADWFLNETKRGALAFAKTNEDGEEA